MCNRRSSLVWLNQLVWHWDLDARVMLPVLVLSSESCACPYSSLQSCFSGLCLCMCVHVFMRFDVFAGVVVSTHIHPCSLPLSGMCVLGFVAAIVCLSILHLRHVCLYVHVNGLMLLWQYIHMYGTHIYAYIHIHAHIHVYRCTKNSALPPLATVHSNHIHTNTGTYAQTYMHTQVCKNQCATYQHLPQCTFKSNTHTKYAYIHIYIHTCMHTEAYEGQCATSQLPAHSIRVFMSRWTRRDPSVPMAN